MHCRDCVRLPWIILPSLIMLTSYDQLLIQSIITQLLYSNLLYIALQLYLVTNHMLL